LKIFNPYIKLDKGGHCPPEKEQLITGWRLFSTENRNIVNPNGHVEFVIGGQCPPLYATKQALAFCGLYL